MSSTQIKSDEALEDLTTETSTLEKQQDVLQN